MVPLGLSRLVNDCRDLPWLYLPKVRRIWSIVVFARASSVICIAQSVLISTREFPWIAFPGGLSRLLPDVEQSPGAALRAVEVDDLTAIAVLDRWPSAWIARCFLPAPEKFQGCGADPRRPDRGLLRFTSRKPMRSSARRSGELSAGTEGQRCQILNAFALGSERAILPETVRRFSPVYGLEPIDGVVERQDGMPSIPLRPDLSSRFVSSHRPLSFPERSAPTNIQRMRIILQKYSSTKILLGLVKIVLHSMRQFRTIWMGTTCLRGVCAPRDGMRTTLATALSPSPGS